MQHEIKKYPVNHPLLKKYIKFFWSFQVDCLQMDHKLIPQRNINLRFNLSETPHFLSTNDKPHFLERVYFSGLQDHFTNHHLKLSGGVDTLGICFYPDGFYPFMNMPVSECKNQILGADEVGLKTLNNIFQKLKESPDIANRLSILEGELVLILNKSMHIPENFRQLFNSIRSCDDSIQLTEFCKQNNISIRTLERMFNKYVGVSANTYNTLNRFHISVNQILYNDYSKLSDLAYDNGYFDQMHFIKDFKRFAGNTPKNFIHQNNSILQIGKIC